MGVLSRYKKAAATAEQIYKGIERVFCPYFKQHIPFNSDGFHHLRFNTSGSERPKAAQMHKFAYIELAREILALSGTVQGVEKTVGASRTGW